MQDAKKQRLAGLSRWAPELIGGLKWMQENRHRFKGKVHEPPRLTVFAKEKRQEVLDMIEGPMGLSMWNVRTGCQCGHICSSRN